MLACHRSCLGADERAKDLASGGGGRGAVYYVLGCREVEEARWRYDLDLADFEGIHVICSTDGTVLTVYRNHDLSDIHRCA